MKNKTGQYQVDIDKSVKYNSQNLLISVLFVEAAQTKMRFIHTLTTISIHFYTLIFCKFTTKFFYAGLVATCAKTSRRFDLTRFLF